MVKQPILSNMFSNMRVVLSARHPASGPRPRIESNLFNMVAVLTVICAISAFSLSYTYHQTKEIIAAANKELVTIRQIAPEFDNDPIAEQYTVESFENIILYPLKLNGELKGTAVKTFTTKGYSGNIWLMVGFNAEGQIHDIAVLEHLETPGLGSNMEQPAFKDQFKGKSPETFKLAVTQDGGNIDAMTGATITSKAFCDAVEKAYGAYKQGGAQ